MALDVMDARGRVALDAEVLQELLHGGEQSVWIGRVTHLCQESSTMGGAARHWVRELARLRLPCGFLLIQEVYRAHGPYRMTR